MEIKQDFASLPLQYVMFAIGDRPRCVWEYGMRERQLEFIKAIDPGYFSFISNQQMPLLASNDENRYRAATLIRATYSQALECLFAHMLAAIQAPYCGYAWLLDYQPGELRDLVKKIQTGANLPTPFKNTYFNFETIANMLLPTNNSDETMSRIGKKAFSSVWSKMSYDFTDEKLTCEYNSIKHGIRVRPRGFRISIKNNNSPDSVNVPLEGSEFGSQFFVKEKIGGQRLHFRGRRQLVNWFPEMLGRRLEIIDKSLRNIQLFLIHFNKGESDNVKAWFPESEDTFASAWAKAPGTFAFNFDMVISKQDIESFTKEEILSRLNIVNSTAGTKKGR